MGGTERRGGPTVLVAVLALVGALVPASPSGATSGLTRRVSVASDGTEGDRRSAIAAISGDGRIVVFDSFSTNLVPDDTNGEFDVFAHDAATGVTERVSLSDGGQEVTAGASSSPDVSADGGVVAFESFSPDVVAGDTNGTWDIFVRDRSGGSTERVSVAADGGNPDGYSIRPSVSADGRYVAFASLATNLVPVDTNSRQDIFVRDRLLGVTTLVSVSSPPAAQQATSLSFLPSISADGRHVAFESSASNLVVGDTNLAPDVFVHDRETGATTRVSVASDGTQGSVVDAVQTNRGADGARISGDGRYVVFSSYFSNLVPGDTNGTSDVFVHDRQTATTTRVSVDGSGTQGTGPSREASISADGRYTTFISSAANLVPDDTNTADDLFIHDRVLGTTGRATVGDDGRQSGGFTTVRADLSADGRYVAYPSPVPNLVVGDTNNTDDIFLHDTQGLPVARPLLLTVGDVAVHEGDAGPRAAVFTVALGARRDVPVSVDYATADGTATAGGDYTAKAGTLVFAPGVTSAHVKVPITADTADEGCCETFTLRLSGASGATLGDAVGLGTIFDNDPPTASGRRVDIGDAAVYEGDAGARSAVFTVSLSTPASTAVTVSYSPLNDGATILDDYVVARGTLEFEPGVTSLPVKVKIKPDTVLERQQRFQIQLDWASGGKATIADGVGRGTIIDDD